MREHVCITSYHWHHVAYRSITDHQLLTCQNGLSGLIILALVTVLEGLGADLLVVILEGRRPRSSHLPPYPHRRTSERYEVEVVVEAGQDFRSGGGVGDHADSESPGEVTIRSNCLFGDWRLCCCLVLLRASSPVVLVSFCPCFSVRAASMRGVLADPGVRMVTNRLRFSFRRVLPVMCVATTRAHKEGMLVCGSVRTRHH